MKYNPQQLPEDSDNVNVSKVDPLQTFVKALIGLTLIFFMAFAVLAGISEFVIRFMPNKVNDSLASIYAIKINTPNQLEPEREKLQSLLDQLVPLTDFSDDPFRVEIIDADYKNAMAFPGRKIAFTTKLLEELQYENEVVMILGHELGHYYFSDHLRSLSRGVILLGLFQALEIGGVGGASQLVSGSANLYNLSYSREAERRADEFGLQLLNKHYGHASGAVSTFEHLHQEGEELKTMNGVFSTHPITKDRISELKKRIDEEYFSVNDNSDLTPYEFVNPEVNSNMDEVDQDEELEITS